jgi:hypothetical protein
MVSTYRGLSAHSDPQAAIKIDKRIFLPDAASQFRTGNHLARMFEEHHEEAERLLLQLDSLSILQQFAGAGVHLEWAKSIAISQRRRHHSPPKACWQPSIALLSTCSQSC